MSYNDEAQGQVLRPLVVCEIDLDRCTRTFGQAPCTAAAAPGAECFNTRATCQDAANYATAARTYRFTQRGEEPVDFDGWPCLVGASWAPTRIEPGDFSIRESVTVTLQDFQHDDHQGVDPYLISRETQPPAGTFFGRLLARNRYYRGRPLRLLEGFVDPATGVADLSTFRTRTYVIESIAGPDSSDRITIVAKDVLKLADNDRAQIPAPSEVELNGAVTAGATSLTVAISDSTAFTAGDYITVNGEVIGIGAVSGFGLSLTGLTRGAAGTTAKEHADGDAVQKCFYSNNENVRDLIETALVDFAGIPSSYIPTAEWDAEESASLSSFTLTGWITEPQGVKEVVAEWVALCTLSIWTDTVANKIKLTADTPFQDVQPELNDDVHFVEGSVKVVDAIDRQTTRVEVYYGQVDATQDVETPDNYTQRYILVDADLEGAAKYDAKRTQRFYSRWFTSSQSGLATLLATRTIDRYGEVPRLVSFDLQSKDISTYETGVVVDIATRHIQTAFGEPRTLRGQIIETKPRPDRAGASFKMLQFFSAPEEIVADFDITTNQTDYDLHVGAGEPTGPVQFTATVKTGVQIDSSGTSVPAINTAGFHPDSIITLVIESGAKVLGAGGAGGAGGTFGVGTAGQQGGPAISLSVDLTIDNAGKIAGGGGGGGGGGAYRQETAPGEYSFQSGGPGGGGAGVVGGSGPGSATDGTELSGGSGATTSASAGGNGGTPGAAGAAGDTASGGDDNYAGGSGGSAGLSVELNGYAVTWTNVGTRLGPVA